MQLPSRQQALDAFVQRLFPAPELSELTIRALTPPGSPAVTIMYIRDLMDPADLERLVLTPLAQGSIAGAPADLARSGRFPAPTLQVAEAAGAR